MTNKEIIQGLCESFAAGDVPAVVAGFADDIEWTESDGKATSFLQHVGSAGVRDLIQ